MGKELTEEEKKAAWDALTALQLQAGMPEAVDRVWNESPDIRAKFNGSKEAFRAYKIAEGQGKISIVGQGRGGV